MNHAETIEINGHTWTLDRHRVGGVFWINEEGQVIKAPWVWCPWF